MAFNDSLSDMLARIKNAHLARKTPLIGNRNMKLFIVSIRFVMEKLLMKIVYGL